MMEPSEANRLVCQPKSGKPIVTKSDAVVVCVIDFTLSTDDVAEFNNPVVEVDGNP